MRHADARGFVRHGDRNRHGLRVERRESLDDRRKIGAGIGEQIVDAARLQSEEKAFGPRLRYNAAFLTVHRLHPFVASQTRRGWSGNDETRRSRHCRSLSCPKGKNGLVIGTNASA